VIAYKPPPYRPSSPYSPKYHQSECKKSDYDDSNDDNSTSSQPANAAVTSLNENITSADTQNGSSSSSSNSARPTSERFRSKSAVVPPTTYDVGYDVELNVEQMLEESWGPGTNGVIIGDKESLETSGKSKSVSSGVSATSNKATESVNLDYFNNETQSAEEKQSEKETDENSSAVNNAITGSDRLRLRKYNAVYSNSEYVYLDASKKIGNSKPRPFTLAHNSSQDNDKKSFSRQNSTETSPEGKHVSEDGSKGGGTEIKSGGLSEDGSRA